MAEVLLLHHALGLTPGLLAFADELRAAGHEVHAPDLYDGNVFTDLEEGLGYAKQIGFGKLQQMGTAAAEGLPEGLVYGGFSLGVMAAQELAQTRPGAKGALLFYSCLPASECGGPWPAGLPAQVHLMDEDQFALEGDFDAARELSEANESVALYLYPGDKHLFADNSGPDYKESAAALVKKRVLEFLERV
ncbi:MAG: dienelactone hydrolase family protein [Actinomycetota bacterium]